jgi:hypothetical protein
MSNMAGMPPTKPISSRGCVSVGGPDRREYSSGYLGVPKPKTGLSAMAAMAARLSRPLASLSSENMSESTPDSLTIRADQKSKKPGLKPL